MKDMCIYTYVRVMSIDINYSFVISILESKPKFVKKTAAKFIKIYIDLCTCTYMYMMYIVHHAIHHHVHVCTCITYKENMNTYVIGRIHICIRKSESKVQVQQQ